MENQSLNVLLIDDDEDDYIITSDLLSEIEGTEFLLDWTNSYNTGTEIIKRNRHDVYLIDYRLGHLNGLDLVREAIRHGCHAPMILLTGQGDREVDLEAMNAGVVMLDLNMPKKDGREALQEIKADPSLRQIPIVILTTSKAEEDICRTYDLGASSFTTKPVTFESLVEVMQTLGKYRFEIVEHPEKKMDKKYGTNPYLAYR